MRMAAFGIVVLHAECLQLADLAIRGREATGMLLRRMIVSLRPHSRDSDFY
jgi:hypothetical protein